MNIFLVNNGSGYIDNLLDRLDGHIVKVVDYDVNTPLKPGKVDLIVLSGSMKQEVLDNHIDSKPWYRHEFDLIQNTNIPIFGICLGHQMVTVALGGNLRKMPLMVETNKYITMNSAGMANLGINKDVFVHKKHQWVADDIADTGLSVLGDSSEGIEVMRHANRRIITTQFHPEIDAYANSEQLFWKLIGSVV